MNFEIKSNDVIGAYQVKAFLNKGGMAYVVLVCLWEKDYALKIARIDRNPEQNQQTNVAIKKEAHLLASFQHDRIVKVYALEAQKNIKLSVNNKVFYAKATELPNSPWYFAMEHLEGGTLDNYVRKCGPLTIPEATNIVGNVGLGLAYLHEKHIAHNDLKPENVVFRKKICKGEPYDPVLIDFGTAAGVKRFIDEAGTLYTMSPERARVATGIEAPERTLLIDPTKSDIWSLGILLYQALTNSLPFSSRNPKTLTSQILNTEPDPIRNKNKVVPKELDDFIVGDCLSKEPNKRPTARKFLEFIYQYSGRGVPAESIKDGYYGNK
jgi:serine/threonine-protein kinase